MAGDVFAGERLGPLVDDVARVSTIWSPTTRSAHLGRRPHALGSPTQPRSPTGSAGCTSSARSWPSGSGSRLRATPRWPMASRTSWSWAWAARACSPRCMARTFPPAAGRLALTVLDTTDPSAIARSRRRVPLDKTLFVASSKSGSTIETRSHLAHFWDKVGRPEQFAVITDPGSALGALAPSAASASLREPPRHRRPLLGAVVLRSRAGCAGRRRLDARLVRTSLDLVPSSGRAGRATIPGCGSARSSAPRCRPAGTSSRWSSTAESPRSGCGSNSSWPSPPASKAPASSRSPASRSVRPTVYGDDRLFVVIGDRRHDRPRRAGRRRPSRRATARSTIRCSSARRSCCWEFATAICGAVLGINPFDQPNVAEAKEATKRCSPSGPPRHPRHAAARSARPGRRAGDYVAVQAYVDPGDAVVEQLQEARIALRDRLHVATTFGLGPRFLHSTGQLHKGGPPTGVFVQVVGADDHRRADPGEPFTLRRARARAGRRRPRDPS